MHLEKTPSPSYLYKLHIFLYEQNNTADGQFLLLEESAGQTPEWIPCADKTNIANQGNKT